MPAEFMTMLILAAVVGLCIGSFLNVVIHRLPRMLEQGWRTQCAELSGETAQPAARYNLLVPRSQCPACGHRIGARSEEHTSELQSHHDLVCRLLLEKKKNNNINIIFKNKKKINNKYLTTFFFI